MNTPSTLRLLIAGCGDLGMRVAQRILQNTGARVWGLRRSTMPQTSAQPVGFSWLYADLSKPETFNNFPQNITHILFCAAPNARTEADYRALYLQGLQNIVRFVNNPALQRIMFVSSSAVYGEHGEAWVDENTPVAPKNFNGRVLLEAEKWLETFGSEHRIATISLRLSGIYGPGRTTLLDRLKLGQVGAPTMPVHWSNRIHIEDAAAAIEHLMWLEAPDLTYLITDSTPLPMRTLYEDLAKQVGGPPPFESSAPAFVGSKRLSNARLRETGFKFKWPDSREGYAALINKVDVN